QQAISAVAGSIAANVGGLIASEVQKNKVKAASAAIRERLVQVVPFLQKEAGTLTDLKEGLGTFAGATAVELLNHGIGSPDPIFADNIGSLGLVYKSGSYKNACQNLPTANRPECLAS